MYERHLVVISVIIILISFFSFPAKSIDISDPYFTNQLIDEIDTPSIEPGKDGELTITLKNPYQEEMENINFNVSIYWLSYIDIDKNISEVDEPPVFDNREIYSALKMDELLTNESEEHRYLIQTSEYTEEGVYSIRFRLEFSIDGERHIMKSRGHFSNEEWEDARVSEFTELNVSGIIPESSFEVRDPVPRWPQYLLGIITTVSGILAVMFYMQEKYNSFPKLEKTFDNWTSKFKEFRSGLNKRFKKR